MNSKYKVGITIVMALTLTGCSLSPKAKQEAIQIAAAASLEECMKEELIPLFQSENPNITVTGMYDSSGKLQTQIEEGADADIFLSAAEKQMNELETKGMIDKESVSGLLKNEIVFIVPAGEEENYEEFEDLVNAPDIAIGDPDSVPAGTYGKEALTNLGIWEEVEKKASLGTNVTEVLNWVAEGSAKAGIVYATDAAQTDKVVVVAAAPEHSVDEIIYPVGITANSAHKETAGKFVEFLKSDKAAAIFEKNGFLMAE